MVPAIAFSTSSLWYLTSVKSILHLSSMSRFYPPIHPTYLTMTTEGVRRKNTNATLYKPIVDAIDEDRCSTLDGTVGDDESEDFLTESTTGSKLKRPASAAADARRLYAQAHQRPPKYQHRRTLPITNVDNKPLPSIRINDADADADSDEETNKHLQSSFEEPSPSELTAQDDEGVKARDKLFNSTPVVLRRGKRYHTQDSSWSTGKGNRPRPLSRSMSDVVHNVSITPAHRIRRPIPSFNRQLSGKMPLQRSSSYSLFNL